MHADSMFAAFKSGILVSAISCADFLVTVTLVLLGVPDPFSTPAAFQRTAAGGVFVTMQMICLSYTEITTGMIVPAWSAASVELFVNP